MSRCISEEERAMKMTKAELKKYVRDNLRFGKVISIDLSDEEDDDDEQE